MSSLVNLVVEGKERELLLERVTHLPSVQISDAILADLEILATGGFSPLDHFMGADEVISVTEKMQLEDGTFFPAPVVLSAAMNDLPDEFDSLVLRDRFFNAIAIIEVKEAFVWEENANEICLAGQFVVVNMPKHNDFIGLRKTPITLQKEFKESGVSNVIAYAPAHAMSLADEVVMRDVMETMNDAVLLLHPTVGLASSEDLSYYARIRSFQVAMKNVDYKLALCPLAMRKDSMKMQLLHVVVEKNFGATHVVIDQSWKQILSEYEKDLGINLVYVDLVLTKFELYVHLDDAHFSENVLEILKSAHPSRTEQGLVLWFTGLSGSGKSTIANLVVPKMLEHGRQLTVLDGDVVRTYLSKGLGFSAEDRNINIMRIGYVASQIARHNGTVICAAISPFRKTRAAVREIVSTEKFIEIHIATTLEECEERDVKGLYAKARSGEIKNFTGIGSPYEEPLNPEITVHTKGKTALACAEEIIDYLFAEGYLKK